MHVLLEVMKAKYKKYKFMYLFEGKSYLECFVSHSAVLLLLFYYYFLLTCILNSEQNLDIYNVLMLKGKVCRVERVFNFVDNWHCIYIEYTFSYLVTVNVEYKIFIYLNNTEDCMYQFKISPAVLFFSTFFSEFSVTVLHVPFYYSFDDVVF